MSLIDRHALLKKVYEHPQERDRMTDGEWCRKCIYEAPEVEAEPVRCGRWIETRHTPIGDTMYCDCNCSICNFEIVREKGQYPRFCENCGARMGATDTNVGGKGGEQEWTPDATS